MSMNRMEKELIDQRSPVQIGAAADPLQPIEKTSRTTLRILKILQDKGYPTVLTTKFPNVLCDPVYLKALDGLPLVVQCSVSSADAATLAALEPHAPSLSWRLEALKTLHEEGVNVMIRLWPFSDLSGNVGDLLREAKASGVKTILSNPLKIYHNGGPEGINRALGRDYLATTSLKYVNGGLFSIMSLEDQKREMASLLALCRSLGLDMLSCDDWPGSRNWRDCCGVGDLPGFHPSPWAYYVRGHVIKEHTDFETYMHCLDCPWHDEFKAQWEAGKLARALPDLVFHPEDLTYSRITL